MSIGAFSGKAEQYEAARPSYPTEAVDCLAGIIPLDAVIADIGAGTGKLTRLLAQRGFKIYGVEPNEDMRGQLASILAPYPNAEVVDGTAEATTLAANSVDLITCAQALHWFEPAGFLAECQRIGREDAWLAAVYNNMDGGRGSEHRFEAIDKIFKKPSILYFDNPISYDRKSWQAYMLSHSHSPLLTDENYEANLRDINQMFVERQRDGLLQTVVQTTIYLEPLADL